jgi:PTS system glucitol/sorbitol-specific IIA component
MMVKYQTTVTSVGPMAVEFAAEGILVFFGTDAPEELHEFAILHEHTPNTEDVVPGDTLEIGGVEFTVTGVGEVANDNLRNLGHLVVKFNALTETELPGEVSVTEGTPPVIQPGTLIRIIEG